MNSPGKKLIKRAVTAWEAANEDARGTASELPFYYQNAPRKGTDKVWIIGRDGKHTHFELDAVTQTDIEAAKSF